MRTRAERKTRRELKRLLFDLEWKRANSRQVMVFWSTDIARIKYSLATGFPFVSSYVPLRVMPAGFQFDPPPTARR